MKNQMLCFTTLFIAIFFTSQTTTTTAYNFKFNSFGGNGTSLITFHVDAKYGPNSSGAIALTRDNIPFSYGRAIHISPVTFKSIATSLYPFKTSFTFSITPKTNPGPGHGLAFIVVPANQYDGSGLGYLSIVNRTSNGNPNNHLFAVEFDVFQDKNLRDMNDNHVEVDINSAELVVSVKSGYWVMTRNGWLFKDLKLSSGDRYRAWIEYNNNQQQPNRPLIEAKFDLSNVVHEVMYIGFAGSMGHGLSRTEEITGSIWFEIIGFLLVCFWFTICCDFSLRYLK